MSWDKFMPELHLKRPEYTYSACEPSTKHRERIQKFREKGNLKHLYRNGHDAAYSHSKDLTKRSEITF